MATTPFPRVIFAGSKSKKSLRDTVIEFASRFWRTHVSSRRQADESRSEANISGFGRSVNSASHRPFRYSQRLGLKEGQLINANSLNHPGGMLAAIKAASREKVPVPHMGSNNGCVPS